MSAPAIDERAQKLLDEEIQRFKERTSVSAEMFERAAATMPFGVASSFQAGDPYPIYLERGRGSHVYDVDGNDYIDFHAGFGAMAVGHAHPKVVEAIQKTAAEGTHFAATTRSGIEVAEELCRRFNMEKVRFTNSGSESTMDAIRLARAVSGKDVLLKIEGSYHGHHDAVMYSVVPTFDSADPTERAWSVPYSRGIPKVTAQATDIVPFNDVDALENKLAERGDEIGAMILEPVMMNAGIILPQAGYLEKVRELCTRHGVVLIFDEVKTGATIAPGGATEFFGVQPDLICLAKSIGGGTPIGAYGGNGDMMDEIENGVVAVGTFNGNPLSIAAARATLLEVLTPDAYEHLRTLGSRLASGCKEVLDGAGIPAHTVDLGCKGSVTFRAEPLVTYRDYNDIDDSLFDAYWYWVVNRGIYQTPGKEEQWTISVQHSEEDLDKAITALAGYCEAVAG